MAARCCGRRVIPPATRRPQTSRIRRGKGGRDCARRSLLVEQAFTEALEALDDDRDEGTHIQAGERSGRLAALPPPLEQGLQRGADPLPLRFVPLQVAPRSSG